MMRKMTLTFLMPSLNEETSIEKTIDSIPMRQLRDAGYEVEVLVVDGGSSDRTVACAARKGARIISSRPGYGLQHKIGLAEATGEVVVTADSDFSYPLEDVLPLLRMLEKQRLDFITTNRFGNMDADAMSGVNKVGNRALTCLTNLLFGLRLRDSQSGMWIIRKEVVPRLNLKSDGMSFSQEIKIESFRKLRAAEAAFRYRKRIGEIKLKRFKDGWSNMVHLFKKRLESL